MAKYSGKGWHFQSQRHSNAAKTGHAGGTYSGRVLLEHKGENVDGSKNYHYTIITRDEKIDFLMKSGLHKREQLERMDAQTLNDFFTAGLEATRYKTTEKSKKHYGEAEKVETAGQVLERLSNSDSSSEQDSRIMQAILRQTGLYPNAVVVAGVVYLDGRGTMQNPPTSIHTVAKSLLKAVAEVKEKKHYGKSNRTKRDWDYSAEENQVSGKIELYGGADLVEEFDTIDELNNYVKKHRIKLINED